MAIKNFIKIIISILFLFPIPAFAHCPLCAIGAGAGAIIAKNLGLKTLSFSVWIGALSVALGWWIANIIINKKQLKQGNKITTLIIFLSILISFILTILPLKPYFYEISSIYINIFGEYGSLFNKTYIYDNFLLGSIIGGLIVIISPGISKKIIQIRKGKNFPFQTLILTFIILILTSLVFQII